MKGRSESSGLGGAGETAFSDKLPGRLARLKEGEEKAGLPS